MNEPFLPNDIARCSNESCSKKLKCARYLDTLPFEQYWYSDFTEDMDCFIEKIDEYRETNKRKRNREAL